MPGNHPTYMCRRPIDEASRTLVERSVQAMFPSWVPSPIDEILWVKRLGEHFGARVILFDDVPCLLLVEGGAGPTGETRWIYRGLPETFDTRAFFFHRMRSCWMRSDGSRQETLERHRWNFV